MKRFTTPTHRFVLEIDPRDWDEFRITYRQAGKIVLEKTEEDDIDITVSSSHPTKYTMSFQLTQEETGAFKPNTKVEMQIRYHCPDGTVDATDIMVANVSDVLNQEILGNED